MMRFMFAVVTLLALAGMTFGQAAEASVSSLPLPQCTGGDVVGFLDATAAQLLAVCSTGGSAQVVTAYPAPAVDLTGAIGADGNAARAAFDKSTGDLYIAMPTKWEPGNFRWGYLIRIPFGGQPEMLVPVVDFAGELIARNGKAYFTEIAKDGKGGGPRLLLAVWEEKTRISRVLVTLAGSNPALATSLAFLN